MHPQILAEIEVEPIFSKVSIIHIAHPEIFLPTAGTAVLHLQPGGGGLLCLLDGLNNAFF